MKSGTSKAVKIPTLSSTKVRDGICNCATVASASPTKSPASPETSLMFSDQALINNVLLIGGQQTKILLILGLATVLEAVDMDLLGDQTVVLAPTLGDQIATTTVAAVAATVIGTLISLQMVSVVTPAAALLHKILCRN